MRPASTRPVGTGAPFVNDSRQSTIIRSISRHVRKSTKTATILFTDIENSTTYFDRYGDVKGRLMVDQHNRLVFPIINRFGGKVIKTTGDGVMASFKRPVRAVEAAIGIQQALERQREHDGRDYPRVRIGIHTGEAIVENRDVFGDVVNVACRVGDHGRGSEIIVSGSTAAKVEKKAFNLAKKGSFKPKGKQHALTVYRCRWRDHPSLLERIRLTSFLPVTGRQKLELGIYLLASLGLLYLLYLQYLRYLVSDFEHMALLVLNPKLLLKAYPLVSAALVLAALACVLTLRKLRTVPYAVLKVLKGGFGFALAFLAFYLPAGHLPLEIAPRWTQPMWESRHVFVEVRSRGTPVRSAPSAEAPIIRRVDAGNLLLLADVQESGALVWNKVLVGASEYGWVPRVLPPNVGRPEQRLTATYKFSFRYLDLYALAAGCIGFAWGFFSFRVRPA